MTPNRRSPAPAFPVERIASRIDLIRGQKVTQQCEAMLSSILRSDLMRTLVKLRQALATNEDLARKVRFRPKILKPWPIPRYMLEGAVAEEFFSLIVEQTRQKRLLSDEHFTVDGTLVEARAGQKSFQSRKQTGSGKGPGSPDGGGNPTVDFRKQVRTNATHESATDPSARLYKSRGAEYRLGYLGHVVTENRNGLVIDARVTLASGTAERDAAAEMMTHKPAGKRVTLGADRGCDTAGFVEKLRGLGVTPHVTQNTTNRRSAIDARAVRHEGYRGEPAKAQARRLARPDFADPIESGGCLLSLWRLTIWFACAISRRSLPEGAEARRPSDGCYRSSTCAGLASP